MKGTPCYSGCGRRMTVQEDIAGDGLCKNCMKYVIEVKEILDTKDPFHDAVSPPDFLDEFGEDE